LFRNLQRKVSSAPKQAPVYKLLNPPTMKGYLRYLH